MWTIGVELEGLGVDAEGLLRLEKIFEREFPDFGVECALWSGRLGIYASVRAITPMDAVESALNTVEFALHEVGIDMSRSSEGINLKMRRVTQTG